MVTWVAKPPACPIHWKDFEALKAYQISEEAEQAAVARLLSEGTVKLEKQGTESRLILWHQDLFGGRRGRSLPQLAEMRREHETLEHVLARRVLEDHWAAAASDMYAARAMGLPLGFGIGLEAKLASSRGATMISPADVLFNLRLPVVDGIPIKELIALRKSEQDAFEVFQDSLTKAVKVKLANAASTEDANSLAQEIQEDEIDPALHQIQQRLHAAEWALRKNHRYNIAIAGLATMCGLLGGPVDLAVGLGLAAVTGTAAVEAKLVTDQKEVSQEGMYFLWRAKEYANDKRAPKRRPRRGKR